MAGAPTSYGYPGSVNAAVLADWLTRVSQARFSVGGPDDWKVTAQVGLDRGIRINGGTGVGDSVMDIFPDSDTRSLPIPAGGSQWFLVAARRNWSKPESTSFVIIPGTSEKRIPNRSDSPGQESDQCVALVRVQANDTVVKEIVDLRVWAGNGGVEAADILGREQLARPGAAVKVGSTVYRYERQQNGVWGWGSGFAHLELFTLQGANVAGALFGPGIAEKMQQGVDAKRTFSPGKFTIGPADRISVNEEGLYSISWLISGLSGASGSIRLSVGNSTVNHASLPFTSVGDMSISLPNLYLLAGDVIGFYFVANKSVQTGHRIRISKIG